MIPDVPIPPEKQEFVIFRSADWRPGPDEPLYAHEWADLLAQATRSLATRRDAYPDWIERGQIDRALAEADIFAWELIAAEWRWIVTGQGAAPAPSTLDARRAAVALSLQRIDAQLRRGNRTHDMFRQAHIAMALEWHLDRISDGEPAVHACARFNHAIARDRAAREAPTEKAA